jgi:hypothetical protein
MTTRGKIPSLCTFFLFSAQARPALGRKGWATSCGAT